ncbi:MAG TPA: DNA alkylation repair protein, partial [Candidatus Saccharimonadales bacterium]
PIHEVRMTALVIMANRAKKADEPEHKALYTLYLRCSDRINNWDLVDVTCRDVVGGYLYKHPELAMKVLTKLAKSDWLWDRRIAMISTVYFIARGQLDEAFVVAELLLSDNHDLMHKAVGWMLRETGKKDQGRLRAFLTKHIHELPRTALRYAIERFEPEERQYFLRLR